MTGMEAAIASGILKVAVNKLVSLLASEFAAISGVKKDLLELQGVHGEIARLLSTARDLSIENQPGFGWVSKVKEVAYDVDDLLHGVHLDAEKHKIASGSGKHAIDDTLSAKPKSFLYRYKVARKIKAIQVKLAAIAKQRSDMNAIGHNIPQSAQIESRYRANKEQSLLTNVEESQIPTRDQEKVSVISKLLESNEGEHGWIVSVVGLGGSGKTTLAKHICHDSKIKEQFKDKIYWAHVSQEFDVQKLMGKLFQAITKKKSDLHAPQLMVDEISKKLTGEKFLLVLDDAWHQDKEDWTEFMVLLKDHAPGSKLMVTTRDQKVAEAVKSQHIINLAYLSEVESWSLFLKNYGRKEEDLASQFIQIGKEIVNKCGGVPLAIKTLGGILSEKKEISTWRAISQSYLWNEENTERRVFASLKLSYIHLKDHLKECFMLCSIYPKGYSINKNYLIEQWIANGFIKQIMDEQPEVVGNEYFDLLVKVGFLSPAVFLSKKKVGFRQDPHGSWYVNVKYKMHDLIHDLAQCILQSEMATSLSKNITHGCTQECRYLSLTSCNNKVERIFFDKVHALCVLEADLSLEKLVKKSRYLCSVVLECAVGTLFPIFILKLNYLGYLEIHNVSCAKLPEGISGCWNLQSLHFISCTGFAALPKSIGKLKKLRTLELTCTDVESLPQSIGECRDLQSLQVRSCEKFSEIPNTIGKNENLMVLEIVDCWNLQQLPSELIGKFGSTQTINLADCESTMNLPSTFSCPRLRTLTLSETRLTKLPEWVTLISTLECINLEACPDLVELPRGIGNLKSLEFLNLRCCCRLHWMPSGFAQLTRLKRLDLFVVGRGGDEARLSDLENLDMIHGDMELKNLSHLMDSSDAEKACLKKKKNIQGLTLSWSQSVTEEEYVSNLGVLDALEPHSEIESLDIIGYRGPHLPCWMIMQSDSYCLESAVLNQTSQHRFLCLINLRLSGMSNLKHMRGLLVLPSLKALYLDDMPNLEYMWITTSGLGIGKEVEVGEQYCFPVLSHLGIDGCPKLIVKPYFPPSLESLELGGWIGQLASQGCSSFRLLPPYVDEPSISIGAFAAAANLKTLRLSKMMASASDLGFLQQRFARLESLELSYFNDLTELPKSMRGLTSLEWLTISNCPTLNALPEWLGELRSLQYLCIQECTVIDKLPWSIEYLTSLTRLVISECGNLKQLPDAIQHLTSLQCLELFRCNALAELSEGMGKLCSLQRLYIGYCPALQYLPGSIQHLTALRYLHIRGCPELARQYEKEVGDDWHLVSHIPSVYIS